MNNDTNKISANCINQQIEPNRLILCLDGTWNNSDDKEITNIVRIRDLVEPKIKTATGYEHQRVYYHSGVGTSISKVNNILEGLTGSGLGRNVRSIYKFLSQHFRDDIEIYIFGFSRGAFTARSLVAYISASGLLKPEHCSPKNEERAWRYYRCDPDYRYPSEYEELKKLSYDPGKVRIRVLGMFDTVGALGVPIEFFSSWNRKKFQFHDVGLSTNVDYAFHALSIDEKRGSFRASLWQYPNHRYFQHAEQVWFPGVHSNIGGGYKNAGLSNRALYWMLSRIEKHNLGLKFVEGWRYDRVPINVMDKIIESRSRIYWWSMIRPMVRIINQSQLSLGWLPRFSALPPHAKTLGEMLDYSVLERWKLFPEYRPKNVLAALEKTFTHDQTIARPIPIVNQDGESLDWVRNEVHRNILLSFLPNEFLSDVNKTIEYYEKYKNFDTSAYSTPYQGPNKSNW